MPGVRMMDSDVHGYEPADMSVEWDDNLQGSL